MNRTLSDYRLEEAAAAAEEHREILHQLAREYFDSKNGGDLSEPEFEMKHLCRELNKYEQMYVCRLWEEWMREAKVG